MRTHDGDRCFKCEECDFIANTERALDQHAGIHTGDKKFECDLCHVKFNLKYLMEKHKKWCSLNMKQEIESSVLFGQSEDVSLFFI